MSERKATGATATATTTTTTTAPGAMDAKGSKVVERSKMAAKGDAAERDKDHEGRGAGKNPKKRRKVNHGTQNLLEPSLPFPVLAGQNTERAEGTNGRCAVVVLPPFMPSALPFHPPSFPPLFSSIHSASDLGRASVECVYSMD